MKNLTLLFLLCASACFGAGGISTGGSITPPAAGSLQASNIVGGTLTLDNQYTYAPITIVATFQTNNMTSGGAAVQWNDNTWSWAGEYNGQQYATNQVDGTNWCLWHNETTWGFSAGLPPRAFDFLWDAGDARWEDTSSGDPVDITLQDALNQNITDVYQPFITDISSYSGVYSFAGTDAYGYQYATNANANQLWFDSQSSYSGSWVLSDTVGGTAMWVYNGVSQWFANVGGLGCGITAIGGPYAAFRTLSAAGMVQLPDYVWNGDENGGTITLNNGYQRYAFSNVMNGTAEFIISALTPAATGKPRWTSLKLTNRDLLAGPLTATVTISGAIGIGTIITEIPLDKTMWITIHDDGQGAAESITYATVIEQ